MTRARAKSLSPRRALRAPGAPTAAFALALASAACPTDRPAPEDPAAPGAPKAELDLPVPEGAEGPIESHLDALGARAEEGDLDAAWTRARYLVELFDDARFRGSDSSLRVFERAAGVTGEDAPAARGPEATDRALEALAREVDRVAALDRLHAGARAARTLIEFDRDPPSSRSEVYDAMSALKAIARGETALASSARLRLFYYGRRAFEDAARTRWADRPRVLAHALYPLYEADPAPYFADDPSERPPPPDPDVLAEELPAILADVVARGGRLADAAEAQRAAFFELARERRGDYPRPLDPEALALPAADGAEYYDFAPFIELDGPAADPAHAEPEELAEGLQSAVAGDGRGRLAVALAGSAPAEAVLTAARVAALTGASEVELLVATTQHYAPPRGDYWEPRIRGERVERAGVIPASVARPEAGGQADPEAESAPEGREGPERSQGEPTSAQTSGGQPTPEVRPAADPLGLHLVVGRDTWRIETELGTLSQIDTAPEAADPQTELADALSVLRRGFSEQERLALVPGEGASYAALTSAATATRDAEGEPFELAITSKAPTPDREILERVLERRSAAQTSVEPEILEAGEPALLRCYRELLDDHPELEGSVDLELGADGDVRATGGPERLRGCAEDALGPAMRATEAETARARLSIEE